MLLKPEDLEDAARALVTGLAMALQRSDLTPKQIKKLRAHNLFADLIKGLYAQRKVFVDEARVLFRIGPDKYLEKVKTTNA